MTNKINIWLFINNLQYLFNLIIFYLLEVALGGDLGGFELPQDLKTAVYMIMFIFDAIYYWWAQGIVTSFEEIEAARQVQRDEFAATQVAEVDPLEFDDEE